jgi:hypothetical protein
MSSPLPSNVQKCREHLVACNRCGDRSPDLHFGAVTGGGRPITSGIPSAQNHFTINITNQPGALIDVGKLNEIASAASFPAPAFPPAPATQPLLRTNLGPNDLRRSLHHRTATSTGQPCPEFSPDSPAVAFPAPGSSRMTKSAKRRNRTVRATKDKVTQDLASKLPAAPASDQMSELLLEVASLRKEVHANRKSSPTPMDLRQRAPSSPPGPAPEPFEDTRLRLSMEHGYYPLRVGIAATPSVKSSRDRLSDTDPSIRPLRDSAPPPRVGRHADVLRHQRLALPAPAPSFGPNTLPLSPPRFSLSVFGLAAP